MNKREELKQAKDDLSYWEDLFKPLGYSVYGWTYRNTAQVISPTGKQIFVDEKILELMVAVEQATLREEK